MPNFPKKGVNYFLICKTSVWLDQVFGIYWGWGDGIIWSGRPITQILRELIKHATDLQYGVYLKKTPADK